MSKEESRVTIHMAASLDGYIASPDGNVDWMEHEDKFEGGEAMSKELVEETLASIDCYVMGSRTYETALGFENKGMGWAYGETPTFVLTSRELQARETVEFRSGDLTKIINHELKPKFKSVWVVGGGQVAGECLRLGLADEVRFSVLPVVIGDGVPFFKGLDKAVPLHLVEVTAFDSGMVAMRHEVRKGESATSS